MGTTRPTTTASRATALLTTAVVLGGTVLTGCSTDSGPDVGAAPTRSVESSQSPGTPEATEPADPPSSSPESRGTTTPSPSAAPDEDENRDDRTDGPDDDAQDDRADPDEERHDDDHDADRDEPAEPELPAFVAYGEQGERVTALQERLTELGYHLPSVDGAYGGETRQALWALQKAAGLYRDGVVGPATQRSLAKGVVPRPRSTSGKVIEIDIDRQLLLAVENGRVVRTINAATGNGERFTAKGRTYDASTPRGDFAIDREIDGMHSSTLELGAMYRPKYFAGPIAVHGSPSVPPVPASHGCVRVSNSAIAWIWDVWGAPRGTRVLVY